jgi:hypothetical protein
MKEMPQRFEAEFDHNRENWRSGPRCRARSCRVRGRGTSRPDDGGGDGSYLVDADFDSPGDNDVTAKVRSDLSGEASCSTEL